MLAVIDYFQIGRSHPVDDFTMLTISKFIGIHIIYRFGIFETITVDNSQQSKNVALYNHTPRSNKGKSFFRISRSRKRIS